LLNLAFQATINNEVISLSLSHWRPALVP
jgi:hypothetical protein